MKASARLGVYGATLVAVFVVSGLTANALIDDRTVQAWVEEEPEGHHGAGGGDDHDQGTSDHGLSLASSGYQLTAVSAPSEVAVRGDLSLSVTGREGAPETDFELNHEQEMHVIAIRADGQHFAHVHPEHDGVGTWSIPWEWEASGTYRIFADFVPAATGEGLTLSTTVQVGGDYAPVPAAPAETVTVDDFDVAVTGDLIPGEASELTMKVTRGGEPVTALEPYLGAFGHLVALRDGDLAYLHVHPRGQDPAQGETSGPDIVFEATAPTDGRYLLFLDFQVDGQVRTAPLVIDITSDESATATGDVNQDRQERGSDDH